MKWQLENDRPIYTQLIEQIERSVLSGMYAPGNRVPGVRELAEEAGVNPNTMQRALAELEAQGLLCTQSTSGRFVTQDANLIESLRTSQAASLTQKYIQDMQALGCVVDNFPHQFTSGLATDKKKEVDAHE